MTDTKKPIEFLFDFGSPNAYLAHKVIPALVARAGVTFSYVPILLGGVFKSTGNQSPVTAYAGIANKLAYARMDMQRFIARHGLSAFRPNPHFPVNTVTLMRGCLAAKRDGNFARYVDVAFAAMWEQGLKLDDPTVFVAALDAGGLDGQALLEATQDPAIKAELIASTEAAVARGCFGSPTFLVGDEIWFGKERLDEVVAAA